MCRDGLMQGANYPSESPNCSDERMFWSNSGMTVIAKNIAAKYRHLELFKHATVKHPYSLHLYSESVCYGVHAPEGENHTGTLQCA